MIYADNLFVNVLTCPLLQNAASVDIISGYATAAMARRHMEASPNLHISLLVGMTSLDGISLVNHTGFCRLAGETFSCFYNTEIQAPIHSKVYLWRDANRTPLAAFIGSANYTQQAFLIGYQHEVLAECDPFAMSAYIDAVRTSTRMINCADPSVPEFIRIFESVARQSVPFPITQTRISQLHLPYVDLPLVDNSGNVPLHSGLNWGQRDGREPNQAYISIPATIARSHFFPPRTVYFNVMTGDGMMTMVVAQDGDKALHTPENNSIIGRYFRNKLNLPDGALVTREDLDRYGHCAVRFYKDDNENYYLEF